MARINAKRFWRKFIGLFIIGIALIVILKILKAIIISLPVLLFAAFLAAIVSYLLSKNP
ncbi:MAG: hypothetical protein HY764_00285 [Candidatus Portnoybacteria bacterium]|nr:hypothetical protein [Candidatus Portnoybacteria bacterium]